MKKEQGNSFVQWLNEVSHKTGISVMRVSAEYATELRKCNDSEVAKVRVANRLINSSIRL